jgi:hypothetical protein
VTVIMTLSGDTGCCPGVTSRIVVRLAHRVSVLLLDDPESECRALLPGPYCC